MIGQTQRDVPPGTNGPDADAFRAFKIELLKQGAEDVPYLVGGAGQGGDGDVISLPSE